MAVVAARGLLLAAGAGRRMGTPKGLLRMPDGTPWVERGVRALLDGGCDGVTVVVGAAAEEVTALVPDLPGTDTAYAADWATGMAASLAAGLTALQRHSCCELDEGGWPGPLPGRDAGVKRGAGVDAAVVLLVDLPDVGPDVVARVLAAAGAGPAALARAAYGTRPGHPVVIGREHWAAVIDEAEGDAGARGYLARSGVLLVECSDLATGGDVDRPEGQGRTSSG